MKDLDVQKWGDPGTGFNGDIHATYFGIGVMLIIEEALNVFKEFWLTNVASKRMQRFWIPLGYKGSSHY